MKRIEADISIGLADPDSVTPDQLVKMLLTAASGIAHEAGLEFPSYKCLVVDAWFGMIDEGPGSPDRWVMQ